MKYIKTSVKRIHFVQKCQYSTRLYFKQKYSITMSSYLRLGPISEDNHPQSPDNLYKKKLKNKSGILESRNDVVLFLERRKR